MLALALRTVAQTRVHVYCSDEPSTISPEALALRLDKEARKRFGDGKVAVKACAFAVEQSLKAYDMEMLRAFD